MFNNVCNYPFNRYPDKLNYYENYISLITTIIKKFNVIRKFGFIEIENKTKLYKNKD